MRYDALSESVSAEPGSSKYLSLHLSSLLKEDIVLHVEIAV
jgi:hypothetical protein